MSFGGYFSHKLQVPLTGALLASSGSWRQLIGLVSFFTHFSHKSRYARWLVRLLQTRSSERLFNEAGDVLTNDRSRLDAGLFEDLVFCGENFKFGPCA